MPVYIGIDPGISGGLAATWSDIPTSRGGNEWFTTAIPMPPTESDIWNWVRQFSDWPGGCHAIIEKVGGYISSDYAQAGMGAAMFTFGTSYGALRMALIAASIPFDEVSPRRWQSRLSISSRNKTETKTQWKNRLKGIAQRLYPRIKVTLATCDALLLVQYLKREREKLPIVGKES